MFFWWICRGESGFPVLFLCLIRTALWESLYSSFISKGWLGQIWNSWLLLFFHQYFDYVIPFSPCLKVTVERFISNLMEIPLYVTLLSCCSSVQFSAVQSSCSVVSDSLWSHELQQARPSYPSPLPEFTQTHVLPLKIFFFAFAFWQFNYNAPWYVPICIHLFGVLQISWNWKSIFLSTLKKFSTIVALNILSFSFYFYYPSEVPIMRIFHFHHVS